MDGYKLIKIAADGPRWKMWKPYHRHIWEQHNGPIPEGMIVTFKDQNPMNCDIENLMLVTRGEHCTMARKNLRSTNPEITEAGLNLVRLDKAIKDRKNEGKTNE